MRNHRLSTICRYLLIGIIFPLIIQYGFYYRFTPNYNAGGLCEDEFASIYSQGIYRYRVVGIQLQLWVYHKIASSKAAQSMQDTRNHRYDVRFAALDTRADSLFFFTFFLIATAFAIPSAIFLLLILDLKPLFEMSNREKILISMLVTLFIGFTQFVITPYDMLSYFLFLFSFWLFLKYLQHHRPGYYVLLCATIAVATFNRESSLLILSFMAAIYLMHYKLLDWRWIKKMILPGLCFLAPYVALRIWLAGAAMVTEGQKYSVNFDLFKANGLMGVLFLFPLVYVCVNIPVDRDNRKLATYFALMASPYIVAIPFIGRLIEFRLWVPVILALIVLGTLKPMILRGYLQALAPKPSLQAA
jgi:hypothetical protein